VAVDQLISEITAALKAINSAVLIEFRQKYIGPRLKKIGNMFRAFDCPQDSLTNRLRTTDVRLLAGLARTHSDMFTWQPDDPVEYAALQLNNILFSVPQISVRLPEQSAEHLAMIRFYTQYFNAKRELLLDGHFRATGPLENYPVLAVRSHGNAIYGCYADWVVDIDTELVAFDLINGKISAGVVVRLPEDLGRGRIRIYDCRGTYEAYEATLDRGLHEFPVPASGMVTVQRMAND